MVDIYLQEFFLFAYSYITKDRKSFLESREGNTYVKRQYEGRQTTRILNFLYNEREDREPDKWDKAIKANIKKIRLNQMDE